MTVQSTSSSTLIKKASTLLRYHLKYFKRFSTNSTVIGTVFLPLYLRPRVLIVYISSPIIIDEMAFRDSAEM